MTDFLENIGLPWGELVSKGLEKKDRIFSRSAIIATELLEC
jgi:hypothetical protein